MPRRDRPHGHGGPRIADADFRRLIDEAKERHNLSDVVSRRTTLKRRGAAEKAGICPFHSEKSPSLEVNDSKGTYYCHGCGAAGDAMTFLMRADGMTFREAYQALAGDDFPTIPPEERARRAEQDAKVLAHRQEVARDVWARTRPAAGTAAEVYARSRGIVAPLPEMARFVMAPRWRNPETGEVGRDYPALACGLQDVDGEVTGVQCVFLANGGRSKYARTYDDGAKAKAKLSFGQIVGTAFRVGGPADPIEIIICEGPEDGLTLGQEFPGMAVWVACGTALMSRVQLPPSVRRIVLAGDNNAAGRAAVEEATGVYVGLGVSVRPMFPKHGFKDWNDQLRGIRA